MLACRLTSTARWKGSKGSRLLESIPHGSTRLGKYRNEQILTFTGALFKNFGLVKLGSLSSLAALSLRYGRDRDKLHVQQFLTAYSTIYLLGTKPYVEGFSHDDA